jgi:hypothetical protein
MVTTSFRRGNFLVALILLTSLTFFQGCTSNLGSNSSTDGSSSQNSNSTNNSSSGNPNFFAALQPGTVVAKFEVENPPTSMSTFILHGTMPIPAHGFPSADGKIPFAIVDIDGTLKPAQVNIATRYANAALDGADVVELMAEVHRDFAKAIDAQVTYEVQYSPYPFNATLPPSNASAAQFHSLLPGQTAEVKTLLVDPNAILLRAEDYDGNVYEANLLRGQDSSTPGDFGAVSATYRTVETMQLVKPASSNPSGCTAYPHLFMVHSYLNTLANEKLIKLQLRISNGWSNRNSGTTIDNQLGGVFIKYIHLYVPQGWNVVQEPVDPSFSNQNLASTPTHNIVELVKARSDGKMIFIKHREIIERTLAITPIGTESHAVDILQQYGLGFIMAGNNSSNTPLFSWQNPLTGRFNPMRLRLTSEAHIRTALRNQYNTDLGSVNQTDSLLWHVITGNASSNAPGGGDFKYAAMDAVHKKWGEYGGFTGGANIEQNPGVGVVGAATRNAYRYHEVNHRMISDRHATAYYDQDGTSAAPEEWLNGNTLTVDFYDGVQSGDPFGDNAINQCMYNYIIANSQDPWYRTFAEGYAAIDSQHQIRYLFNLSTLVWLGNSWLAKDDLIRDAEYEHFSYHHYNGTNGSPTDLLGDFVAAQNNPHHAAAWGRGQAWIWFAMSGAYSVANDAWRQLKLPYFQMLADTAELVQIDCNPVYDGGLLTKKSGNSKILPGTNETYWRIQQWEEMLILNSLRAVNEAVLRDVDNTRVGKISTAIRHSANAMLLGDLSNILTQGPSNHLAVAYQTGPFVPFCSLNDVTPAPNDDWHSQWQVVGQAPFPFNTFYSMHHYGLAYQVTGDSTYLQKAVWFKNTTDLNGLMNWAVNQGTSNLENNLNLLAAVRSALGVE